MFAADTGAKGGGSRPCCNALPPRRDEPIRSHDGCTLRADVLLPDCAERVPALLAVGPHGKALDALGVSRATSFVEAGPARFFVERGYAVVRVDVRGTGASEGEWTVFSAAERRDLRCAIEWAAAQPWCSGSVGMMGMSYFAISQWMAAADAPVALKCIAPFSGLSDVYLDVAFPGGVFGEGFVGSWFTSTRLRNMLDTAREEPCGGPFLDSALRHPLRDAFWQERSALAGLEGCRVPTYAVAFWGNAPHLHGTLAAWQRLAGPKRLLVLAAPPPGARRDLPPMHAAQQDERVQGELLRWYDHWLKGMDTLADGEPAVRLGRVGSPSSFVEAPSWPPPGVTPTPLFLSPRRSGAVESLNCGSLLSSGGSGVTTMRVPDVKWSFPGPGTAVIEGGPPNGTKRIFTFSSAPLARDVELAGPISCVLFVETDMPDLDVVVRLMDQPPEALVPGLMRRASGASPPAARVSAGWLKASHRALDAARATPLQPAHRHDAAEEVQPGRVYRLEVEMMPTACTLRRGHVLRLEVAPADSGILDRPLWHRFAVQEGAFSVHHGESHVLLPVVGGGFGSSASSFATKLAAAGVVGAGLGWAWRAGLLSGLLS